MEQYFNKIDQEVADKLNEKYESASDKFTVSQYAFSKLLVTLSTSMVAILVALTKFEGLSILARISFMLTLICLIGCIIFSLLYLYSETDYHSEVVRVRREMLEEYLENPHLKKLQKKQTKVPTVYLTFKILSFLFFGLWGISIIAYLIIKLFC